jgi:hypothetical protein
MRRLILVAVFAIGIGAAFYFWPRSQRTAAHERDSSSVAPASRPPKVDLKSAATPSATGPAARGSTSQAATDARDATAVAEADFPIAISLNAPESTIAKDLDIVRQLFETWQSNFPREGNPVGENADITAALMGENKLGLALIPKGHRAVNERGELCDRWGTPFRFHQLSGTHMEIRSAGPDRKFATEDDAVWTPQ